MTGLSSLNREGFIQKESCSDAGLFYYVRHCEHSEAISILISWIASDEKSSQ